MITQVGKVLLALLFWYLVAMGVFVGLAIYLTGGLA